MTTGNGNGQRRSSRSYIRGGPKIPRPAPIDKIREAVEREDITAAELAAIAQRPIEWAEKILAVKNRPANRRARQLRREREAQRDAIAKAAAEAGLAAMFQAPGQRRPR